MPYNATTIQLLARLGLNANNKDIYHNVLTAYKSRNDIDSINRELVDLQHIIPMLKERLSTEYNLLADESGYPRFESYWDPYFLCYTMKAQIAPGATADLAGREIIIRLSTRSSNNNFNPQDVQRMFESKFNAAQAFNPEDKKYQTEIAAIKADFMQDLQSIMDEFYDYDMATIRKNIITLQRQFIACLALELTRSKKISPTKAKVKQQVKSIRNKEIEIISAEKRPLIINCYPLEHAKTGKSLWVYNTNIPRSDISSAERSYKERELSNYWFVTNRLIKIRHQTNLLTLGSAKDFSRSASFAKLEELTDEETDDLEDLDEDVLIANSQRSLLTKISENVIGATGLTQKQIEQIEFQALKKYVKQSVIRELVDLLLSGGSIDLKTGFVFKLAVNTLLSPIISKPNPIFSSFTPSIFGDANEHSQLESLHKILEKIEKEKLNLDKNEDIIAIQDRLEKKNHVQLTDSQIKTIKSIKISTSTIYCNIPVNKIGTVPGIGHVPLEKVGKLFAKFNSTYNAFGMQKYAASIQQFIKENYSGAEAIDTQGLFKIEPTLANWTALKEMLSKAKDRIPNSVSNKKQAKDLQLIITCYINIHDHLFNVSESNNARIANGYLIASSSLYMLNHLLGYSTHITCKSGKDRSGLYSGLREAFLAKGSEQLLIKNICNVLKYSAIKDLNQYNAPGCRGLQVDDDILDGLVDYFGENLEGVDTEIAELIKAQMLRKIGKMAKHVFVCDNEIQQLLVFETGISSRTNMLSNISRSFKSAFTSSKSLDIVVDTKPVVTKQTPKPADIKATQSLAKPVTAAEPTNKKLSITDEIINAKSQLKSGERTTLQPDITKGMLTAKNLLKPAEINSPAPRTEEEDLSKASVREKIARYEKLKNKDPFKKS